MLKQRAFLHGVFEIGKFGNFANGFEFISQEIMKWLKN
jgi:hypothetical protein